jgi:hypothetical protein
MYIETLLEGHVPGIFVLVHELEKKIDVRYSVNCSFAIASILRCIDGNKELVQDIEHLEYKIIETVPLDNDLLKIRHSYWVKHYKDLGYSFYRKINCVEYKFRKEVDKKNSLLKLYIVNRFRRKILLGIFEDDPSLEEFIETYYKDGINSIVYYNNELTKNYYIHLKKRIRI